MAVSSVSLTTLVNLKSALGIASADTSKDTLLEQYIDRATFDIEGLTGRKLKARNYDGATAHGTTGVAAEDYLYFDGTTTDKGGDTLVDPDSGLGVFHVPQYPIQKSPTANALTLQLAVLSERSSEISGGNTWDTDSYVEWDQFIVDYENGIIRLTGGTFAPGMRNYRLKCTAGYQYGSAQPYVPPDLEQLCVAMVKKLFRNEYGVQSESLGTWSRSYDTAKQDELIDRLVARYTRFSF